MQQPNTKKYDMDIPVYHGRFSDAMVKIRDILKGYQHSLSIVQREENGATTSLEVTIVLKK